MAVHLPLSEEAQREAREIIASNQNVLQPSSGEPVITHSQDMVIGIYYLTDDIHDTHLPSLEEIHQHYEQTGEADVVGKYCSMDEVLVSFENGDV